MDSLPKTLLWSSSSAEDFGWLCINYKSFLPEIYGSSSSGWKKLNYSSHPLFSKMSPSTQWSYSPNHTQWGHLPLFILFLSPRMPFSTPFLHSDTISLNPSSGSCLPSLLSSILWAPAVILHVLFILVLYRKLPLYCYLTFFVFIFKSILVVISKYLLDTYCVPGNNECCGYINMNKITLLVLDPIKKIKYKVH